MRIFSARRDLINLINLSIKPVQSIVGPVQVFITNTRLAKEFASELFVSNPCHAGEFAGELFISVQETGKEEE